MCEAFISEVGFVLFSHFTQHLCDFYVVLLRPFALGSVPQRAQVAMRAVGPRRTQSSYWPARRLCADRGDLPSCGTQTRTQTPWGQQVLCCKPGSVSQEESQQSSFHEVGLLHSVTWVKS